MKLLLAKAALRKFPREICDRLARSFSVFDGSAAYDPHVPPFDRVTRVVFAKAC